MLPVGTYRYYSAHECTLQIEKRTPEKCPSRLVAPDETTMGTRYSRAMLTIFTTSSVLLGRTYDPSSDDWQRSKGEAHTTTECGDAGW